MNATEYNKLSTDLRTLAKMIPLHWGAVQNNQQDDKLDMFSINHFEELQNATSRFSDASRKYWFRRWYLWKCAQVDEHIFCMNENTVQNPNPYDKSYDIAIDSRFFFDVKGTIIPRSLRGNIEEVIKHPEGMVKFFYEQQSTGRRYAIQNRLFIVHHSFVEEQREFYLRCAWGTKEKAYRQFVENVDKVQFVSYGNVIAGVIFLLEREKNHVEIVIPGL